MSEVKTLPFDHNQLPGGLGQATSALSFPVVLASDQSALPITIVATKNFGASADADRVAALLGNEAGVADFGAGALSAQTLRVVLASDQAALPLPADAATQTTLAAADTKLGTIDTTLVAIDTKAGTTNTTLAAIDLKAADTNTKLDTLIAAVDDPAEGRAAVDRVYNDYTTTNVTTAAYVEVIAATAADINTLDIFDSSGEALILALGGAGSEVDTYFIAPGGNGIIQLAIPSGTRVSVKALTGDATVGFLLFTALS